MAKFRFIDLFCGIGGFHIAFSKLGGECVFSSDWDKHAQMTYEANFGMKPHGDILAIQSGDIPDHDILCAGFPCQPFSQAGYKRGFLEEKDKRGNMFFELERIIDQKKPKVIFLENVRHLLNHENGQTFNFILNILESKLNYEVHYKIIKASECGLPQHRPRLFIIGFRKEDVYESDFIFPNKLPLKFTMSDVFGGACNREIGFTLRVGGRNSGLDDRRNWDTYLVDGHEVFLTPKEGKKMMGFPEEFIFPVSQTQAMKQLGNSVAVNAIYETGKMIVERLDSDQHIIQAA